MIAISEFQTDAKKPSCSHIYLDCVQNLAVADPGFSWGGRQLQKWVC